MHHSLGQVLCSRDRNAIDLIDDKRIALWITAVQDDLRSAATCLYEHISGARLVVRVEVDFVAHPTEEPLAFDRGIVCLTVAIEALLAH